MEAVEALVVPGRSKVEDKKGLDGVIYLKNILQNFNSQSGLHDFLFHDLHSSALSPRLCTSSQHVATTKCPDQVQYFRHFFTLQLQHGDVAGDRGARKIKLTFCREELYADFSRLLLKKHLLCSGFDSHQARFKFNFNQRECVWKPKDACMQKYLKNKLCSNQV